MLKLDKQFPVEQSVLEPVLAQVPRCEERRALHQQPAEGAVRGLLLLLLLLVLAFMWFLLFLLDAEALTFYDMYIR